MLQSAGKTCQVTEWNSSNAIATNTIIHITWEINRNTQPAGYCMASCWWRKSTNWVLCR